MKEIFEGNQPVIDYDEKVLLIKDIENFELVILRKVIDFQYPDEENTLITRDKSNFIRKLNS